MNIIKGKFENSHDSNEDRRIRRTKKLLKEALISLIGEKGFDEVSVQDIIDRADVGRTSFYTYFRSKEDLLMKNLDDLGNLLYIGDPNSKPAETKGGILEFLPMFLQHLDENRPIAKALLGNRSVPAVKEHVQNQFLEYFKIRLQDGRKKGTGSSSREGAAVFASGAILSLVLWWLDSRNPLPTEKLSDMMRKLLLEGLTPFLKPGEIEK